MTPRTRIAVRPKRAPEVNPIRVLAKVALVLSVMSRIPEATEAMARRVRRIAVVAAAVLLQVLMGSVAKVVTPFLLGPVVWVVVDRAAAQMEALLVRASILPVRSVLLAALAHALHRVALVRQQPPMHNLDMMDQVAVATGATL